MKTSSNCLDLIQIASPCSVSWEAMKGDGRVRFCSECRLNVYNLSEMGREEAEEFVGRREGRTCVRFFRREDGTVLTKDCPVGVKLLKQRLVRAVAAVCGILLALLSGTLFGGVISRRLPSGIKPPGQVFAEWIDPTRNLHVLMGDVAMGGICAPPQVPVTGKIALEPAETPLLAPTEEQLVGIRRRLEE